MIIKATPLLVGAGISLTMDREGELTGIMMRPGETRTVSDRMRSSKSVRDAIRLGFITVSLDFNTDDNPSGDYSDFVDQSELNALAALVSGFSGFSGFSGHIFVGTKFMQLDFHGAADTAIIESIKGTPALVFKPKENSRSIWSITLPDDYQPSTPIIAEIYWSPSTNGGGSVKWVLEYKAVAPGGSVATIPLTSTLIQPSPGVANDLVQTGTSLSIPMVANANDLINLAIKRDGKDPSDTFAGTAQVHLVRVHYTGIRTTA